MTAKISPPIMVQFTPNLSLTAIEHKILILLVVGIRTKNIPSLTNRSISAVNRIIAQLKLKTDSSSLIELGQKARQYQLISEQDIEKATQIKHTLAS